MSKIALYFGTDSGTTRLIAKKMARVLGNDIVEKPLNINRVSVDEFLSHKSIIVGTPSYGEGLLPGKDTGVDAGSWQEFLPLLEDYDLSDYTIAVFGLGDQDKYAERFADAMIKLYRAFEARGARMVGHWSTDGYCYQHSASVVDNEFVGLAIDHCFQSLETDSRIEKWLEQVTPELIQHCDAVSA